jgi:hypothetical protein
VVGVEQGGSLAARLIAEEIAPNGDIRFAGAHLIDTVVAAGSLPACDARNQPGCVVAWRQVWEGEDARARRLLERGLVWNGDRLENSAAAGPLRQSDPGPAHARARAGPLAPGRRQRLAAGVGRAARPAEAPAGRPLRGRDPARQPARIALLAAARLLEGAPPAHPFNLFYGDLEADAQARVAAVLSPPPAPTPAASRTAPPAL